MRSVALRGKGDGSGRVTRSHLQLTCAPGMRTSMFVPGVSVGPPEAGRRSAVLEEREESGSLKGTDTGGESREGGPNVSRSR